MHRLRESNPHFLPRQHEDDPVIEFPSQLPQHHPWQPPRHTAVEPSHGPRAYEVDTPPHHHRESRPPFTPTPRPADGLHESRPPFAEAEGRTPQDPHHESRPHFTPLPASRSHGHHSPGRHGSGRRHSQITPLRGPGRRQTRPIAWLVAIVCVLFWLIVIIGGLIILIIYLVFRPRNPKFDISTATLNAAYLDMGYLLNADVTILANFTNPNTKVNVDFTYVVLDIYYEERFIATRYIDPFSIRKLESRFADVHLMASQVTLSMGHSMELQRQIATGRVKFEIRGLFKTRSRLEGFFRYTYWLYTTCHIVVTSPPTGVLIAKQCVTRR